MTSEQEGSGDTEMKFIGIFKSLDAVKKCLNSEKYFSLPEVQELLKVFNDNYTNVDEVLDRSKRKVFIVLEGIDASGKTTISNRLSRLISGCQLGTPPPALLPLRETFDGHELELRRAYYALGNYLAAQNVKMTYTTQPVIMDRFWHSTAAYAIAQQAVEKHNGNLPPENHDIYEWPKDLLKPDIVFFLSVSESKRLDRLMRRRTKNITREELKMKDNKALRDAMLMAYLRMKDPKVRTINADHYPKSVLKACMNTLTAEQHVQRITVMDPTLEGIKALENAEVIDDLIVMTYLHILQVRAIKKEWPSVFVFSLYFMNNLLRKTSDKLRTWTKKIGKEINPTHM